MTERSAQSPVPAWGSVATDLPVPLRALDLDAGGAVDRLLVQELFSRYCWAYDERRMDVLAAVYAPDAVWGGSVGGEAAIDEIVGRTAIVDWLAEQMAAQPDQRRHNVVNTVYTSQGPDQAQLLCYLLLTSAQHGATSLVTTGFYRVDVVRAAEGWLIKRVFGGFDNAV